MKLLEGHENLLNKKLFYRKPVKQNFEYDLKMAIKTIWDHVNHEVCT